MDEMYAENPDESESTIAMPIMPILPAKDVSAVRIFLVDRLFAESLIALSYDIDVCFSCLPCLKKFLIRLIKFFSLSFNGSGGMPHSNGLVSLTTTPSFILTILSAYSSARSSLCVTIMTSLSLDRFFRMSMTCCELSLSSAPVGSSASRILGLFTMALAIATRCICPPESWLGFL